MNVVMSVLLAIVNNTNKLFDILMEVWKEIKDKEKVQTILNGNLNEISRYNRWKS